MTDRDAVFQPNRMTESGLFRCSLVSGERINKTDEEMAEYVKRQREANKGVYTTAKALFTFQIKEVLLWPDEVPPVVNSEEPEVFVITQHLNTGQDESNGMQVAYGRFGRLINPNCKKLTTSATSIRAFVQDSKNCDVFIINASSELLGSKYGNCEVVSAAQAMAYLEEFKDDPEGFAAFLKKKLTNSYNAKKSESPGYSQAPSRQKSSDDSSGGGSSEDIPF